MVMIMRRGKVYKQFAVKKTWPKIIGLDLDFSDKHYHDGFIQLNSSCQFTKKFSMLKFLESDYPVEFHSGKHQDHTPGCILLFNIAGQLFQIIGNREYPYLPQPP